MSFDAGLKAHLGTGATTVCHAWRLERADGVVMGFTDHDVDLGFDGLVFRAGSGLTALALQQGTGLAVDNSEAIGALSDAAIREADIEAGRFDGAVLVAWLVNWANVDERQVVFRGTLGEIRRSDGMFRAELRGLTEALNQPVGRVYQRPCSAVLGDGACGVDLGAPGYRAEVAVVAVEDRAVFRFGALDGFDFGWFQRGRLEVLSGAAAGLSGVVKRDVIEGGARRIELWQPVRAEIVAGDMVRLEAGCDRRFETCRLKFDNVLNFQGFPDIPGEDWIMASPRSVGETGGGSRR
ncbi:phage protein [Oceanicola sp. 22II-s10i]|uniref:DUF2163 domain-containing protein n=1 Tax=Oceanicola sp. 22II-s10i TaxID=1317116 RepID=UPI000B526854|nr:DUF2163 domain-containing protein [Oceanicola sp. 22II-s10i]OWU85316.1 phage protein [Oceanicola sp. 22II-s10i]